MNKNFELEEVLMFEVGQFIETKTAQGNEISGVIVGVSLGFLRVEFHKSKGV